MADREKLIELQEKWFSCDDRADLEKFAEFLIANGVVVQRHGKWIPIIKEPTALRDYAILDCYKCSECGRYEEKEEPYCHCGAKMDGD